MTTEKPDEQIDAEAVAERKLRNDAGERAEDAARQQSTGALPQTLPTLKYLPVERQQQYERQFDGTFRLAWISSDDQDSFLEHEDAIASGGLRVLPPGVTPASEAKAAARAKAQETEAKRLLDAMEEREREERYNAARDKALSDVNARFAR
jgi:hypothetical protein